MKRIRRPEKYVAHAYETTIEINTYADDGQPMTRDVLATVSWTYPLIEGVPTRESENLAEIKIHVKTQKGWRQVNKNKADHQFRAFAFKAIERARVQIRTSMMFRRAAAGLLRPSDEDLESMTRTTGE